MASKVIATAIARPIPALSAPVRGKIPRCGSSDGGAPEVNPTRTATGTGLSGFVHSRRIELGVVFRTDTIVQRKLRLQKINVIFLVGKQFLE